MEASGPSTKLRIIIKFMAKRELTAVVQRELRREKRGLPHGKGTIARLSQTPISRVPGLQLPVSTRA
jgi:hypothetical protein